MINYIKTLWQDKLTKLNAHNMNKIEDGLKSACDTVDNLNDNAILKSAIVHNADISDSNKIAGMDLVHSMQAQIMLINETLSKQHESLRDCNNPTSLSCFCDINTLNTPNKQGLTDNTEGRVLSVKVDNMWNQQMYISNGGNKMFMRFVTDGEWTQWVEK